MIGTLTDGTDREERERELERRNERLDEFAGVVSHDLRNPLQVASGRIELASEECDSEFLDDAEDALDQMGTLIDDLLAIARDGTRVREFETVDLEPLVEACWSAVATPEVTLTVESPSPVRADRGRLRQLVENLLANAVEYGGPDVTVTVSTLDVGFYVADDGPGVPEGEREAVFDTGYTSGDEGTGFGLAIAEEIAMAHDWEIRVRESDGGGARFEITGVEFA
jgi:signal transduction histidine kinase